MKLVDIPGVGPRLKERLVDHYGSEERALDAVMEGDIAGLLQVLSERQALSLLQAATAERYGATPGQFLATEEAERIYRALVGKIASHAHTEYARLKMGTVFPSDSIELIESNRRMAALAMDWAARLEGSEVIGLLRRIKPLREKAAGRAKGRAIVAGSLDSFQELKSRGLDRLIDIHLVESPRELFDIRSGYGHVCLTGGEIPSGDVEEAESLDDWYLVPEAVLSFFQENIDSLKAAAKASKLLEEALIPGFAEFASLEGLLSRLGQGNDSEAGRLEALLENLHKEVDDAVIWANSELKGRIEASSVTLAGMDILQVLGRGEGVRELFQVQMRGMFQEVLAEARDRTASRLDLLGQERVELDWVFASEVGFPLEIDRRALHQMEHRLRREIEASSLVERRELARALHDRKEEAERMVHEIMEFDFLHAIGSYAISHGMTLPEIVSEPSIGFLDGRNVSLEPAEPVSYSLGKTGLVEHEERVVILSGVNSGGKTTLLDLIAQIAILAQMGLPVPATKCRLSIFQELYYFSKSRGTLSAGAFETAMRKFSVVGNDSRKLVLADELEAITEPGASGRIIGSLLDELQRHDSVAVFVSHLAEEVTRFAETPVRVDGIEAEGLDKDNNLIVARSPRYDHLARSTPELILARLVRSTKGQEREFYQRLLDRFDKVA
ncbi:MAG: DNA mismatch repair protein MutS [Methanotrichaceae archaeon]|nr:DNA mismatch repair protein MutS [Methanotrichaceae archaeon]